VTLTGTGYSAAAAKSIVRTSSTSLIITRPDNFPVASGPYTITVSNPGVTDPVGSSANILVNGVTGGVSPAWVTNATLPASHKELLIPQRCKQQMLMLEQQLLTRLYLIHFQLG
jgi:hypothetical protein